MHKMQIFGENKTFPLSYCSSFFFFHFFYLFLFFFALFRVSQWRMIEQISLFRVEESRYFIVEMTKNGSHLGKSEFNKNDLKSLSLRLHSGGQGEGVQWKKDGIEKCCYP